MEKTKNYSQFKFRKDNRSKIDFKHVARLVESIKNKNLLEFRPIIVTEDFEVLDGQHRLLAARELGEHIYYEKRSSLTPQDIISLNVAKPWNLADYLNFYAQNRYPEYVSMKEFCFRNRISIQIAMRVLGLITRGDLHDFRSGLFKFPEMDENLGLSIASDTIEAIVRYSGRSSVLSSAKFWDAILSLAKLSGFDRSLWLERVSAHHKLIEPKISSHEYLRTFIYIYNQGTPESQRIS